MAPDNKYAEFGQQTQTPDLCLLPFDLPKKHKKPESLEANLSSL